MQVIGNWLNISKMCKNTFDYYHHALEYVPDCYMTQEMLKKPLILLH